MSRFAWRKKHRRHSMDVLAAIIADIKAHAPAHIVITGDLTNFSTPEEFGAARSWLEAFAPSDQVTVSPGNHDVLTGNANPFEVWTPWLGDSTEQEFPQVRRRGAVAIVNLSSAAPTALHLAQGVLGGAQLDRLSSILRQLREEGLCRVLLIHHPPTSGVVSRRKSLKDSSDLRAVLKSEGAELVLHGHAHHAGVAVIAGPTRSIPVLSVPSASSIGHGDEEAGRWHHISISQGEDGWEVEVAARGLGDNGLVEELGRYALTPMFSGDS